MTSDVISALPEEAFQEKEKKKQHDWVSLRGVIAHWVSSSPHVVLLTCHLADRGEWPSFHDAYNGSKQ